jgi:UDP-N-acetylglucosamine:LPS N-acetylglucosamine transferase
MKEKEEAVVLVYGFGGHNEQMKRLYEGIQDKVNGNVFITICDSMARFVITDKAFVVNAPFKPTRLSYLKGLFTLPKAIVICLITAIKIRRNYKIKMVLSTGPSIGLMYGFFLKYLCNCKFIYLETWSRFYSRSAAGRLAYIYADYFFIQNESLRSKYKRGIYLGRL